MSSADNTDHNNHVHPDRLLPMGVLSQRQESVSDLYRWGVAVELLRKGGATDKALVELHDGLAILAVRYGKNLEAAV